MFRKASGRSHLASPPSLFPPPPTGEKKKKKGRTIQHNKKKLRAHFHVHTYIHTYIYVHTRQQTWVYYGRREGKPSLKKRSASSQFKRVDVLHHPNSGSLYMFEATKLIDLIVAFCFVFLSCLRRIGEPCTRTLFVCPLFVRLFYDSVRSLLF
jgi:hypothetical protein